LTVPAGSRWPIICATHDLPVVLRVPGFGLAQGLGPVQGLSSKRGNWLLLPVAKSKMASPRLRMLLRHCVRRAASRALCTAGDMSATRTAMIEITTNSSISVKPVCVRFSIEWGTSSLPLGSRTVMKSRKSIVCSILIGAALGVSSRAADDGRDKPYFDLVRGGAPVATVVAAAGDSPLWEASISAIAATAKRWGGAQPRVVRVAGTRSCLPAT